MGLDMYLYRVPKELQGRTDATEEEQALVPEADRKFGPMPNGQWNGTPDHPRHTFYMPPGVEEVMYWRKENAIHAWFVRECGEGIDSCQPMLVHPEKLAELGALCEQVLEDPSKAGELLPTQSGFFFGDTSYDEWYLQGLKETAGWIRALGRSPKRNVDFIYQASW